MGRVRLRHREAGVRAHPRVARGARALSAKLNAQRPWVTKDPRMCLVADEWMPLLDAPLCLIVHREPLSVANSMMIYSHNVSLAEWASVYESVYTNAQGAPATGCARARSRRPRSTFTHTHGATSPGSARPGRLGDFRRCARGCHATHTHGRRCTRKLPSSPPLRFSPHSSLSRRPSPLSFPLCRSRRSSSSTPSSSPTRTRPCASSTPTSPPPASLASRCPPRRGRRLLRPSTKPAEKYLLSERNTVGPAAQRISAMLSTGRISAATPEPATWLTAARKSDEAFATLLTTDNADYLRGALVLGSSIRTFDSSRDMVALVTDKVPAEWHASLNVAGWTVRRRPGARGVLVGPLAECSHYAADQGERWGHMATKLRLWELTQYYKRVLYLDADTVLTGPVSETFSTVTTFGAEAPKYHAHFNAGVLLLFAVDDRLPRAPRARASRRTARASATSSTAPSRASSTPTTTARPAAR